MASCITSQWANNVSPQVRLTVTESSSTATTTTLYWVAEYVAHGYAASIGVRTWSGKVGSTSIGGEFAANGITGTRTMGSGYVTITKTTSAQTISFSISFPFNMSWSGVSTTTRSASGSISVAAKTSYTISYNANGGAGAPSAQSKWHGTNITLSSTKPTKTGYIFQGWGTSTSDTSVDYAAGATYSANATITLYAIWKAVTYTVTFDANGGTGAPSAQTKTYGVTLTLSTTVPTKTNYNFLGWGTSASATTVSYAAGANYTTNAAITLYAIWELAYIKPRINNLSVDRCLQDGTANEEGTYARLIFDWACDLSVTNIAVSWISSISDPAGTGISASGTSGSVNTVIGDGSFSTDVTYTITVAVSDSNGSFTKNTILNGIQFPIDVLAEAKGIAFGKAAEKEGFAEFAYEVDLLNNKLHNAIIASDDVIEVYNVEDEEEFNTQLDAIYSNMGNHTVKFIDFRDYPTLNGNLYLGILWRCYADYGCLLGISYNRTSTLVVKRRFNDAWVSWERRSQSHVVETGTSGIWTYKKWSDGKVELWGKYSISNLACTTALGSWYRTPVIVPTSFPFNLSNIYLTANYESDGYGAMLWATTQCTSTTPSNYYLIRPTSATIASGVIVMKVIATLA